MVQPAPNSPSGMTSSAPPVPEPPSALTSASAPTVPFSQPVEAPVEPRCPSASTPAFAPGGSAGALVHPAKLNAKPVSATKKRLLIGLLRTFTHGLLWADPA